MKQRIFSRFLISGLIVLLLAIYGCGPNPAKSRFHLENGIEMLYFGQHNEAMLELNKALKYDSESFEAYYYRGAAKRNLQDMEGAYDDFQKSLELNPNYAEAHFALALIYEYRNDKSMACYYYLKAEELGMINIEDYTRWCK